MKPFFYRHWRAIASGFLLLLLVTVEVNAVNETLTPAPSSSSSTATPAPAPEENIGYDGKATDSSLPIRAKIVSPANGEIVTGSTVDVFVAVDNYVMAVGGNRLHIIINNGSPIDYNDPRIPLTLRELPEGGHTIRVMAVGPDGRAFTNPEAFSMIRFFVRKKNFQNYVNPQTPFLTLNLPIDGTLDIEEGSRIGLDWLMHNTQADPNKTYQLHYELNKVDEYVPKSGPIYWDGLKAGHYELTAELVDQEKHVVPGEFNRIKRIFDIRVTTKASAAVKPEARNSHLPPAP